MPVNGTVNDLPLRAIILNIGTTSYHPAKQLAKMLSALSKSEHTADNNLEFINNMKRITKAQDHELKSFDAKSLFTNVSVDFTIDLILKSMYDSNEKQENIIKKGIKELLIL